MEHPVERISGFVKINHYKNLVRIGNIMTSFISGVHVLLVSLFGIPIVWSISDFLVDQKKFGIPKRNLVDQKNIWYTKKNLVYHKKYLVDQKNEKLTRKLVYQRD